MKNQKTKLGLASVSALKQYFAYAADLNIDLASLLEQMKLDPQLLDNNDAHVSGEVFQHLILELVRLSSDPLYGLHTAKYVQPGSYHVLGFISMNCQTLGEVISKISPFERLIGDMGVTRIEEQHDLIKITWHCRLTEPEVRRHVIDNCLASWLIFARYLLNRTGKPNQVHLTHAKPGEHQVKEYEQLFQCQVLFNQADNSLYFSKHFLALPLNKGSRQLLPTLERHALAQLEKMQTDKDIVQQTAYMIGENLSSQQLTQENIAKSLGMSGKTLQRKLNQKNTHFKQIHDQTRLVQAKKLLDERALIIGEISLQLGFAEPRSFHRWFLQQTGQTPGQFRKYARN